MCIARVGKVVSTSGGKAVVEFFDGRDMDGVDVSVVRGAMKGSYIEVFGNLALSVLSEADAKKRKVLWEEVMKAAAVPAPRRRGRR